LVDKVREARQGQQAAEDNQLLTEEAVSEDNVGGSREGNKVPG